ncbi:KpsF/GutQ family sugar-phosphate isomerase [Tepidicaulis sp. LMO-SS28]|uniref:KpsF/GutQ family sugar-phosphate isomerase n=1 Tax=Tepidicaulis sp. LMO-SS28 TaxID=3447455 RepID=UPI003EE3CB69
MTSTHIASAKRTLELEIKGLEALAASLGPSFEAAVERLSRLKGRVIVTGMGKSGHVGRKIAATLASTGTPAQFVHPGEASHGDLGMVTPDDAVIALSWGGESTELHDILVYAKRFAIPLIAVTSNGASTLGEAADIVLELPRAQEACAIGMAPTTSTTMQLALGDALAVALMEVKGFAADDYKIFHPGGKLGAMLQHVRDLMHKGEALPLAQAGTGMSGAIIEMTQKRLGCLGVVDAGGKLTGLITDGDLRRHMGEDILEKSVDDIMTRNPKVIDADMTAAEALNRLNENQITVFFVVDAQGRPVGLVHIHDFLRTGVA